MPILSILTVDIGDIYNKKPLANNDTEILTSCKSAKRSTF